MTTVGPTHTLGQAVEAALVRLKIVWRRHEWTPELLSEYRRVLSAMAVPAVVERAIQTVIDATEVNYPPTPGVLVQHGKAAAAKVDDGVRNGKPRFVEAAPDHRDPPSTVRYVVIQPDGRRIPSGARIAGEF